ncbi:hypothetical protein GCM10011289_19660 [Paludibacterium paludis]|uniref:Methanobactin biosynthesis cassette protein MbnC n=1 Tax=Paludibacterium paludis TaxID=1225769 RepID=A0A918P3A2_9NEIS|nr:hypothetical protein GCM10011289_19660 [Paludibacterium paludis]
MISEVCRALADPAAPVPVCGRARGYLALLACAWRDPVVAAVPGISDLMDLADEKAWAGFLGWCRLRRAMLDWRFGVSLLAYLLSEYRAVPASLAEHLLLFACSQWTYSDKGPHHGILIASSLDSRRLCAAEKSTDARLEREVFVLSLDSDVEVTGGFAYATYRRDDDLPSVLQRDWTAL